jgi:pimeloyl-ACP methyl ester carboxylesterase
MCDATVWAPLRPRLDAVLHQGGRVDGPDGNDAAFSVFDPGARTDIGAMAEALLARAPARFALAGHSMGGRIALEVVRRAPQRVQRLALLSTGCQPLAAGEPGERERAGRARLQALARRDGVAAMAREWVQGMVHPQRLGDADLVEAIVAMMARRSVATFEAQIRALLGRPDAEPVLRGLRMPTLMLCGQDDAWSPPERHRAMAACAPGARLVLVPQAGHMVTLEQPEAVAAAMVDWLLRSADAPDELGADPLRA